LKQRTSFDVAAYEFANALVGVNQPAANLIPKRRRRVEREWNRHTVAWLLHERAVANTCVEVDASAIETRWRACLQPAHLEAERANRLREIARRRLTMAAGQPVARNLYE
jgi:hypothetical protein